MAGTFFGISVAQSALAAQRRAMDVLGYNIANANDPTYKRQRVVMVENSILATSQEANSLNASPFGTGVGAGDVERIRDTLIEHRLRVSSQTSSNWEAKSKYMQQLETIIGEPSDTGLQSDLDNFWNSWSKVATSPDSKPLRAALLEDTTALCQRMQYTSGQMRDMIDDFNLSTQDKVSRLNLIGEEISKLNNEIGALESGQVPINDLQNRRDALVLELSKLCNINQHGDGKESYIISIGGRVLVQGSKFNALTTTIDSNGNRAIKWADDLEDVNISNGELKAIKDLRDITIPDYLSQLDNVATNLVEKVNAAHAYNAGPPATGGMTMLKDAAGNSIPAGNFFMPNDPPGTVSAANIQLDPSIVDHPELVGVSATGAIGDGEIARQIAAVKDSLTSNGLTINQCYRAFVQSLGSTSSIAQRQEEASKLSTEQFSTQMQSISGVSLDEEMTNMIKFQQAFNASARVLTVMDEMLGNLITSAGGSG